MTKSKGAQLAQKRRRVLPNGRSAPANERYASIPARLLASNTYRSLTHAAIRVHLLAEAAYTPNSELTLPHNKTRELLHASDTAITKAKGDLAAAGIMILVSPGIAPNRMGGQSNAGRAAVFALPHRKSGCLPNECLWGRDGGPAREGYWRIHCDYLRWLIENLSAHALRVFVFLHATNHTEAGMVADISGRAINHNEVGLTKPTCARAICELLDRDILEFERRPAGRRAATYRLCVKARGGIRNRRPS